MAEQGEARVGNAGAAGEQVQRNSTTPNAPSEEAGDFAGCGDPLAPLAHVIGEIDDPDEPVREDIRRIDEALAVAAKAAAEAGANLARLSAEARVIVKQVKAVGLAGMIDAHFKTTRDSDEDGAQGDAVLFPAREPASAPEPDGGAALIRDIVHEAGRHLVLPCGAPLALALWVAHTHTADLFDVTPYLQLTSPTPECGKSTVLDFLRALSARAFLTVGNTAPVVFRVIQECRPTLLLDEASFTDQDLALVNVLLVGYRRGAVVARNEKVGQQFRLRCYQVFGPKAFARVGKLPDGLESRCITVEMQREAPPEPWEHRHGEALAPLRHRIERWADDNRDAVKDALVRGVRGPFKGRRADIWRPLFAVADVAGIGAEARKVARALSGRGEAVSYAAELLRDIRAAFHDAGKDALATSDLIDALCAPDDAPYVEINRGKRISGRWLAARLKPFGIRPRRVESGSEYHLADFDGAFRRYVPSSGGGGSEVQEVQEPSEEWASGGFQSASGRVSAGSLESSETGLNTGRLQFLHFTEGASEEEDDLAGVEKAVGRPLTTEEGDAIRAVRRAGEAAP